MVGDGEEWLAYQWIDATGDGIYLARPDGSGQHQILTELAGSEIHPDWSPDGQRLAFVRITPEDQSELWVVNADGTGEELLYRARTPATRSATRTGTRMARPSISARTRTRRPTGSLAPSRWRGWTWQRGRWRSCSPGRTA